MVLIPDGTAVWHDKQAKNQRAAQMKKIEKNKSELLQSVQTMLHAIEQAGGVIFEKSATDANKLYDSISAKDVANKLHMDYKIKLGSEHFQMEKIEELGEFTSTFSYESLTTNLPIKVVKKTD